MSGDKKGKQSKFEMVIGAVDRFSHTFHGFGGEIDKSRGKLGKLDKAVHAVNRATGFDRIRKGAGGVTDSFKGIVDRGRGVLNTLTGIGGKAALLFGAGTGGLLAMAKGTADAGDAVAKSALRAGVGITLWQEYAYAAEQSGVSLENMESSFLKFQEVAKKAATGDKKQLSLLKSLGIDPKTAKGEVKSADSLFLELADAIQRLQKQGQGGKASNILASLGGAEAVKLLPLLAGGAENLLALRQRAHDFHMFDKDSAENAGSFNASLADTLKSLKGIGYEISVAIMPKATELLNEITKGANTYRETIGDAVRDWVKGIDVKEVWEGIKSGLQTIKELAQSVNSAAKAFGGWGEVLKMVGYLMAASFIGNVAKLIGSLGSLGTALVGSPLWAALAALGVVKIGIESDKELQPQVEQGLIQRAAARDPYSRAGDQYTVTGKRREPAKSEEKADAGTYAELQEQAKKALPAAVSSPDKDSPDPLAASGSEPSASLAASGIMGDALLPEFGAFEQVYRSEHVERQENTVTLIPPEGWGMQMSGPSKGVRQSGASLQVGQLATGTI